MALFLALALVWSGCADAEEASSSPWQGEWFGSAGGNTFFGLTIKNCRSSEICEAEAFGLNPGKYCLQKGMTEAIPNADELVIHLDRGPMVLRGKEIRSSPPSPSGRTVSLRALRCTSGIRCSRGNLTSISPN